MENQAHSGTLYLVPTPIGNLEDISPRAIRVLQEVDIIAAEDTRDAGRLLKSLSISTRTLSYHDHNERERAPRLVSRMKEGARVALITDAGTPLIDDPGYHLVVQAIAEGIPVVSLPGPCAGLTALVASGLPIDRFYYLGFLPRNAGRREAALLEVRHHRSTLVLYEAPHRLLEMLESLEKILGDRRAAVGWNLTKPTEAYFRGTLTSLRETFGAWEYVHGEITLVVEGATGDDNPEGWEKAVHTIEVLLENGVGQRVIRDLVSTVFDLPRRDVYQRVIAMAASRDDMPPTDES